MGSMIFLKFNNKKTVGLLIGLIILLVSLGLAWISSGFENIETWWSFLSMLLIGASILLGGWIAIKTDRKLDAPKWLGWLLVGAAILRLAAGVFWLISLPKWGYESPVEQAGYVMADAHARDEAAWELAQSGDALWTAFHNYRNVDQYGGLLFLSGLVYRYLGGNFHQPLQMVVLTASFSSLVVIFTWAVTKRLWNEQVAKVGAWFLALYPEAVLLGSSQMREAFTITLVSITIYGLVRFWQDRSWEGLAYMAVGFILSLPFSPPFTGLLLILVIFLAISLDGWRVLHYRWFWLVLGGVAIITGLGIWLSWERLAPKGLTNPLELIGWWIKQSVRWQAVFMKRASDVIRKTFKITPEWSHLYILLAIGIFQPFLPAALIDSGNPIWRGIAIWRALGWTILLPILFIAPVIAWNKKEWRGFAIGLCILVWTSILLASLRGGGDLWDNPRYRVTFVSLEVMIAAWVISDRWDQRDIWLRRAGISMAFILAWFLPWYLRRTLSIPWPVKDVFKTLGLGIASVGLFLLWDWSRTRTTKDTDV